MEEVLIFLGICVLMPVMIVWLVMRARQNETDRKTEIMLKAIEAGATLDTNFFKASQGASTIKERLLKRLSSACVTSMLGLVLLVGGIYFGLTFGWELYETPGLIFSVTGGILFAIGVALFIVFFVGKKMLEKEIKAEEKSLEQK